MEGAFVPSQLVPLLGRDASRFTVATIESLLDLPESGVLEFKRECCWRDDSQKLDLAADVCAFANREGGLMVIGVTESTGKERAMLSPISNLDPDEEELRIRQIVASRCYPMPALDVVAISSGDESFLVLSVPPSSLSPHTVTHQEGLRYPVREGPGKRYLSESEIAHRYRNRFATSQEQVGLGRDRHRALTEQIRLDDEAWLTLTLHPTRTGQIDLSRAKANSLSEEIRSHVTSFPSYHGDSHFHIGGGFRSYKFSDDPTTTYSRFGELHADGGGVVAHAWNFSGDSGLPDSKNPVRIGDEHLIGATINSLVLLSWWATEECGAGGDAILLSQVHAPAHGAVLWQNRSTFPGRLGGSSHLEGAAPISEMTVDLTELSMSSQGLMTTARNIAQDMLGGFQFIEPFQVDREGRLRIKYFHRDLHQRLRMWADDHDLEVTEDAVS